ncbi:pilus assembly FimT family protein [Marinagarivorans algicola]|uniref:pilus assembly FimT family protein n=1 Tax=Marinagarivorans algicola TaxID=1513270 RepID=UPI0012E22EC3|nr:type II secretion system protein [Marinagarivorans algicola]
MKAPKGQVGFTLLEVLAVIAVLGIAMGVASLTIGRGGAENRLTDKIEQFMALSEFASDRAILSGDAMGLLLEPPQWQSESEFDWENLGWRYRWQQGNPQGMFVDIPELEPISFDPETQIVVLIDDLEWRWEELLDRSHPVTAYYSSGDISPIEIIITDERLPDYEQTIHINEYGQLEWKEFAEELKAREDSK